MQISHDPRILVLSNILAWEPQVDCVPDNMSAGCKAQDLKLNFRPFLMMNT